MYGTPRMSEHSVTRAELAVVGAGAAGLYVALCAAAQIEQVRADGVYTDGETEGDCGDSLPLYKWKQTMKGAGLDGLHEITVTVENARTGEAIYKLKTLLFDSDYPSADNATEGKGKTNAKKRERRNR